MVRFAVGAVDVGGVEERDAVVERPIHDRVGVDRRRDGAEVHRAERNRADQ
jgi:hypothetical protein